MVRKKILLVEDSRAIQELLGGVLQAEGYSVNFASDGNEALKLIDSKFDGYDLLIVDCKMPGMGGLSLIEKLRRFPEGAGLPIIILTDSSDPETVKQAKELAVSGYFLKSSFDYGKFKELLATIFKSKRCERPRGFQIPISSNSLDESEK